MESGRVKRRTSVILAHLTSHDDISATAIHILPMSCSNSISSVIRRRDNKTNFARQGSDSQGCFMRPASTKQDAHLHIGMPLESTISGNKRSNAFEPPLFSRPAQVEPGTPFVQENQSVIKGGRYRDTSSEAPMFARPNRRCDDSHIQTQKRSLGFSSHGKGIVESSMPLTSLSCFTCGHMPIRSAAILLSCSQVFVAIS